MGHERMSDCPCRQQQQLLSLVGIRVRRMTSKHTLKQRHTETVPFTAELNLLQSTWQTPQRTLERHTETVSAPATILAGSSPAAAAAFRIRAPSM